MCTVCSVHVTLHYPIFHYITRFSYKVYQNLAISSENYRTFPKVGPHHKEKVCKFLARSDYSLRPNSCILFEMFTARRSNLDT